MKRIFYPAVVLMNHLRYPQKMILMAFVFSVPLSAFVYLLLSENSFRIVGVKKELQGIVYEESLMKVFLDMQQHRGMAHMILSGDRTFEKELMEKQLKIDALIKEVDHLEQNSDFLAGTEDRWSAIKKKWHFLRAGIFGMEARESFDLHTELIQDLLLMAVHAADSSGLTFDLEIDSYYLMDTMVDKLPRAIEYAGQIRGQAAGALVHKKLTPDEKAYLTVLSSLCRSTMEKIDRNLNKVFQANSSLRHKLEPQVQKSISPLRDALDMVDKEIIYADIIHIGPSEYFNVISEALDSAFLLHNRVTAELNLLLKTRARTLLHQEDLIVGGVILSVTVLMYLFIGNYFSVVDSLSRLVRATKRIGDGEQNVQIMVSSHDEVGELAESFNEMTRNLSTYTVELKTANEGLKIENAERKKAEMKVERTAAELKRSNKELEQFAYIASHDLKEPLLAVAVDLKLIQRRLGELSNPEIDSFIEGAIDAADRMQTLIGDLLLYSRAGSRGKAFKLIASEKILQQSLENLKVALDESGAAVTHDALPSVMADSSQLLQLFQNLINNAIKFRRTVPAHIHVSAERKNSEWVFAVRDNGIGIPNEQVPHIFELFHRTDREKYAGTGIGLATCKKIVERHGGKIWVETEEGRGSTFYFTLPA